MMKPRPPIVTVLGHVDHGKTSLLDALRKTSVATREAGGITQGIGASRLVTPEGEITFVDTPGHAAFSAMRARGARVADIAILVVAADSGVMPQTKEAIGYVKENAIPFIVAFTKVDLPSANVEQVKSQLMEEGIFLEGMGGEVPFVEVSVKQDKGIKEIVELILLLAGVTEIRADPEAPLRASIIETNRDKRGTLVSAVIKEGTLRVGDEISAGAALAKVKGLFDDNNRPVRKASPGEPVLIMGFAEVPEVGVEITEKREDGVPPKTPKRPPKVKSGELAIILKTRSVGPIEAVIAGLPEGVVVLQSSVGEVTESDVFLAKATGAMIIAFEAGVPANVKRLAETEGVEIARFDIIYEIFDYLKEKRSAGQKSVLGRARILAEFPFDKTKVAGCRIVEGVVHVQDRVVLVRGEKELGEAKIVSMRREKNALREAKAGEECGVVMAPLLPFEKGDILVAIK